MSLNQLINIRQIPIILILYFFSQVAISNELNWQENNQKNTLPIKNNYNRNNDPPTTIKLITIDSNTKLSIKLLNLWWDNREDINNQKILINYFLIKNDTSNLPQNYELLWKTARLIYFIGNYGEGKKIFIDSKNKDSAIIIFNYGAEVGKLASKLQPNSVEGHYWYAINLGSYGLAKGILASAMYAKSGMNSLKTANVIDSKYNWCGSSRILGRYNQELPYIIGGSSSLAKGLLLDAVDKCPTFNNNWLFLGNYYNSLKDYTNALASCNVAKKLKSLDGKYEDVRYQAEINECIALATQHLTK